jgi:hypothetical protein
MRALLEPTLGPTGALIAQFVVTLAVVLLLLLAVVWLVRRFSPGRVATGGRGRLPRLAIVDAMAVDNRRKLVLVRRDNVEHLILIGGPSDLVVEPGIMRQRTAAGQRQAAAQPAAPGQQAATQEPTAAAAQVAAAQPATAAPAVRSSEPSPPALPPRPAAPAVAPPSRAAAFPRARPEAVGTDQPIPFPPRRAPAGARGWLRRDSAPESIGRPETEEQPAPRPPAAPAPAGIEVETGRSRPVPASARFEEMVRPTAIQPGFALADEPDAEPELPPPLDPEEAELGVTADPREAPHDAAVEYAAPESEAGESAPAPELQAAAPVTPVEASETSVKVSDLEKEMARLLGEISTSRSL